jgi:putative FmdB family regulatory protein
MPVYEYRCENGHNFEVTQRMSDDPVTACPTCGAAVKRVFHPIAVHFKGSGFYTTDYGRKKGAGAASEDGGGSSESGSGGAKKDSGEKSGATSGKSDSGKSDSGSSGGGKPDSGKSGSGSGSSSSSS